MPSGTEWDKFLQKRIMRCGDKIGHVFRRGYVCLEALNLCDKPVTYYGRNIRKNDRLVLIGTQIINTVLMTRWYRTKKSQDVLNDFLSSALSDRALCRLGSEKEIDQLMNGDHDTEKEVADAVRALVGAVFYDDSYVAAYRVVNEFGIGDEFAELLWTP